MGGYINCHLAVARRGCRYGFEIALFGIKNGTRGSWYRRIIKKKGAEGREGENPISR